MLCCSLAMTAALAYGQEDEEDDEMPKFTIGSKAPALDIEHWVSDGDGKYPHTKELKSDTVYVIEFWATWCGPCIASMPHLKETQEKYADKGVQLISISDEDLETVEEFLEKPVRGKKDMTYGELTSTYCLTADPDKSVMDDYFRAAGQRGIPCAFIVGKEGLVEWIGHPMQMDEPLEKVIDGKWDREAYAVEMKEKQRKEAEMMRAQRKLQSTIQEVQAAMEDGDTEEGLKLMDEAIADESNKQFKPMLEGMRGQMVIMFVGGAEAVKELKKLGEQHQDNAQMLNQIAWTLYEKHAKEPLDKDVLAAATELAELAVKAAPEDGAVLDTLAHFVNENGDLDRAIELQEKAVEFVEDANREDVEAFLEELKAKKEKDKK
jgi:thiol-disulfide isomerase/thioredoxin